MSYCSVSFIIIFTHDKEIIWICNYMKPSEIEKRETVQNMGKGVGDVGDIGSL